MDIKDLKRGMNTDMKPWKPDVVKGEEETLKIIKQAGFDHVRLPFSVIPGDENCSPSPKFYEVIRKVAQMAVDNDLTPIVDIHPFAGMNAKPHENKDAFIQFWAELADYLKDMDDRVVFEIYNEPDNDFNYTVLNDVQNKIISEIRKKNPVRRIAAATAHCNTIENLMHLTLPEDDKNIFVTVHEYTPMKFTHQGADWMKGDWPKGIHWGAVEEKALLDYRFDMAKRWSDYFGRFIHLGEFGAIDAADMNERALWTEYLVKLCEDRGFGWCYWEMFYSYKAYNAKTGEWVKPIYDALMNHKIG